MEIGTSKKKPSSPKMDTPKIFFCFLPQATKGTSIFMTKTLGHLSCMAGCQCEAVSPKSSPKPDPAWEEHPYFPRVCIYVYIYICAYICIYMYIYIIFIYDVSIYIYDVSIYIYMMYLYIYMMYLYIYMMYLYIYDVSIYIYI